MLRDSAAWGWEMLAEEEEEEEGKGEGGWRGGGPLRRRSW
jgi:hypothetical protein